MDSGNVDVWHISLDRDPAYVSAMYRTLAQDEASKVARYIFDEDRNRFIVARAALRKVLSGYLRCGPEHIQFSYNGSGKPFLNITGTPIRFNLTHSQGLALIAVARHRDVGVDLEFIDTTFPVEKIAPRLFSPTELSELKIRGSQNQTAQFFQRWTRREAYLKGVGTGLSVGSRSLSDLLIKSTSSGLDRVNGWTLTDLAVDHKYKASLAVKGKIDTIRYAKLDDRS